MKAKRKKNAQTIKKEGAYEYPYYIEVNYNDKICNMFCNDNCNTIRGKIIQLRKIGISLSENNES
jgi:hypothetical protein